MREATARIKINKLLEAAGWRFFADSKGPANIQLEPSVTLTKHALDDLGENFEKVSKGFIDFLLLDERDFPFIVLEAKAADKNPLVGKEQARKYAKSQNCRFVIVSNGNFTTSGTSNEAILTSSQASQHRVLSPATKKASLIQNSLSRKLSQVTTLRLSSDQIMLQRPHGRTNPSAPGSRRRPRYARNRHDLTERRQATRSSRDGSSA
jgi:type I site-specific restriction endonuclease